MAPSTDSDKSATSAKPSLLAIIGPGLLLAATGVGAGDLATASFAGSLLGTGVLWAVLVGAFFKFVVTEGLARWQLATDQTLLEGVVKRLGRVFGWLFLPYLMLWSFFVAAALMSACGVTLYAMLPVFADATQGKIAFGVLSSAVGLGLVLTGGFRLFERVMRVCIALMFVTVIVTAAMVWPGTTEVLRGLFIPTIPDISGQALSWTVALMGGVGGTFTVLSYGYWIREEGRAGAAHLRDCRLDLGMGYFMTAVFGIAMVIVGSTVVIEGSGATLLVKLSDRLADSLGPMGKWMFLIAAFGAVFSSLLGVWQAVPYLFADTWGLVRRPPHGNEQTDQTSAVDTRALPYRTYLMALATVPIIGLFQNFQQIQKVYAIVGASFVPLLALILLVLNSRTAWVGAGFKNSWRTNMILIGILVFFTLAASGS